VVCTFPYNKLPFEFDENNMVKGYYFDADKTVPKYRLCEGKRCEIARLPKWKRSDFYTLKEPNWKITKDVENNDMMPLVNTVLDSGKSWNINGRAGTGKSHLIKMIQEEMNKREIKIDSLAPTNKAALIINGKTMHKFKHEFNLKHF
jgi:DNA replication protein DnaC